MLLSYIHDILLFFKNIYIYILHGWTEQGRAGPVGAGRSLLTNSSKGSEQFSVEGAQLEGGINASARYVKVRLCAVSGSEVRRGVTAQVGCFVEDGDDMMCAAAVRACPRLHASRALEMVDQSLDPLLDPDADG